MSELWMRRRRSNAADWWSIPLKLDNVLLNLCYQSSSSSTNLLGSDIVPMYLFVSSLDWIDWTTRLRPGLGLRANQMIEPDLHPAVDTCTLQYGHL